MRIAYIGAKGLPARAGADRVVEAVATRLARHHEVAVYCSSLEVPNEARFGDVELIRVRCLEGKHLHAFSLFVGSALHAVLRRRFDVVHVHNTEACFVLPVLKLKYSVVATSHGQPRSRQKWGSLAKSMMRIAEWSYFRFGDRLTAVSSTLARDYQARSGRRVEHIPNGVDVDTATAGLAEARTILESEGLQAGSYVMFAAGRIIPTKGATVLLQAYRQLGHDIRLLVVGDAEHVPGYERELRQLADSRVVFLPPVERPVLLGLAKMARFFVFPSKCEGMSMVLLEAASVGAPLVCSDIAENKAVVGDHAVYFASGDCSDLLEKMCWALDNPGDMRQLGMAARSRVSAGFRWDSIALEYERLYQAVVSHSEESRPNAPPV